MICTIIAASALSLLPVEKPVYRSIGYFDSVLRVTERVLDRTICEDIERVQALDVTGWDSLTEKQKEQRIRITEERKAGQREALEQHCRKSTRVSNENECNLN